MKMSESSSPEVEKSKKVSRSRKIGVAVVTAGLAAGGALIARGISSGGDSPKRSTTESVAEAPVTTTPTTVKKETTSTIPAPSISDMVGPAAADIVEGDPQRNEVLKEYAGSMSALIIDAYNNGLGENNSLQETSGDKTYTVNSSATDGSGNYSYTTVVGSKGEVRFASASVVLSNGTSVFNQYVAQSEEGDYTEATVLGSAMHNEMVTNGLNPDVDQDVRGYVLDRVINGGLHGSPVSTFDGPS